MVGGVAPRGEGVGEKQGDLILMLVAANLDILQNVKDSIARTAGIKCKGCAAM